MSSQLTIPSLLSSHDFYLAAGTVTVDAGASKVLIIRDRTSGVHKLPRGRKDWNETLEAAAERETFEESGVRCHLLPVPLRTRATPAPGHPLVSKAVFDETGDVTSGIPLTEPIAMMQHYQDNGALAVVFFFVATADSTTAFTNGTQNVDEDYEAMWVPFQEVNLLLKERNYADIVKKGIQLAKLVMADRLRAGMEDEKQAISTSLDLYHNGVDVPE